MPSQVLKWGAAAACLAVAGVVASGRVHAQPAPTRTVYVSAVDDKGAPVTGLTAADLTIKEDGKAREIVKMERATTPMKIALIVDDNGTGIFRAGIGRFMQAVYSQAEFSITSVQTQAQLLTDFTRDQQTLVNALNQIGPRPATPEGGQLLEAIDETAKKFEKNPVERPVIIALSVGGDEHSTIRAELVMNDLKRSRSLLHVLLLPASAIRQTAQPTNPGQMLDENMNLGLILGDGPKQTGGRAVEAVATAGLFDGLQQIGEEMLQQYAVSYAKAPDAKPTSKLQVETKRKGVKVRAPQSVSDR